MILVTGGAGFIGANFVLDWLERHDEPVLNVDKLTYAGNQENLAALQDDARHHFVQADIGDSASMERLLAEHKPRAVLNFAATVAFLDYFGRETRYRVLIVTICSSVSIKNPDNPPHDFSGH